jgi:ATP-binding protein involved in chromosome partitioning
MGSTKVAAVESALAGVMLAPTAQPLGGPGSTVAVSASGDRIGIDVSLGFPAHRYAAELEGTIAGAIAPLGVDATVTISSRITSHAVQQGLKPLPGVANLIAVGSGKGGVGKSTVAVNLALALAREGASVGLLDADIYGPSVPRMLGLGGRRPDSEDGKTMNPLSAHGITAMSIGFLVDDSQPMAWRGPMVTSALTQLLQQTNWGELDYLLIDMPPGTGDIQLTLAQRVPVTGAVIVTTPQDIALSDARKGLEMFQKVNVPILGIVENMALHRCSQCGHEERIFGTGGGTSLASDYSVPLLGSLPLDRSICELTDVGTPPALGDGALARHYGDIALRLAGELAAERRDYSHLFPSITVEDD